MDENENIVTEEHPFGIEPETYSELEENHPKLYKNTDSGTSTVPTGNPFDGGGSPSAVEVKTVTVPVVSATSSFITIPEITKLPKFICGFRNMPSYGGGFPDGGTNFYILSFAGEKGTGANESNRGDNPKFKMFDIRTYMDESNSEAPLLTVEAVSGTSSYKTYFDNGSWTIMYVE